MFTHTRTGHNDLRSQTPLFLLKMAKQLRKENNLQRYDRND